MKDSIPTSKDNMDKPSWLAVMYLEEELPNTAEDELETKGADEFQGW